MVISWQARAKLESEMQGELKKRGNAVMFRLPEFIKRLGYKVADLDTLSYGYQENENAPKVDCAVLKVGVPIMLINFFGLDDDLRDHLVEAEQAFIDYPSTKIVLVTNGKDSFVLFDGGMSVRGGTFLMKLCPRGYDKSSWYNEKMVLKLLNHHHLVKHTERTLREFSTFIAFQTGENITQECIKSIAFNRSEEEVDFDIVRFRSFSENFPKDSCGLLSEFSKDVSKLLIPKNEIEPQTINKGNYTIEFMSEDFDDDFIL